MKLILKTKVVPISAIVFVLTNRFTDDVGMPEGLPPGPNDELVESDDDIPMPEGPPPGQGMFTFLQPGLVLTKG